MIRCFPSLPRRRHILPALALLFAFTLARALAAPPGARPNVLIAISDDQSWPHASAYGCKQVQTPAFDRVASRGTLFRNAICPSPGCSPSRAALLTGMHPWMLEQAGTHASSFPRKFETFPDTLAQHGYFVGMTGKGWGPGSWKASGRTHNPAGPEFQQRKVAQRPSDAISEIDYAANFAAFLSARPKDQPFCFWYGAQEPHRKYDPGSGVRAGKNLAEIPVPPFLPDTPAVRSDIADYLAEVEWFDAQLAKMLRLLEERGELENTLVIVTSDNGMPFPRAKANAYEYGIHVPLAISWPARFVQGRQEDAVMPFVDLTATVLDAAGVAPAAGNTPVGTSWLPWLARNGPAPQRHAFASRERHSSSRFENHGYPQRAVRTEHYLYLRNLHPDWWPAGDPQEYNDNGELGKMGGSYHDIDPGPTLESLRAEGVDATLQRYLHLAVDKRPLEELYDITADPGCLHNLAGDPQHAAVLEQLRAELLAEMKRTGDSRLGRDPEVWETYERFEGKNRRFPPSP
ncbi:sulfatase [Opitutus sp. ER46]|uniref:sulfatase family protein n=1 Tax=Opitutus sp. ER46 TaxID=2161864 RepID=UPI000D313405|nr:sulfatase [Opitutus sp. ER46]PTX98530.1 heparan N-sulfatase [Opitutus sp. ER46]